MYIAHPLIYDWNHDAAGPRPLAMLDDETLRDGLQSPSVRTPSLDERIDILHHMNALGITTADIGLPGAGPKVARDVEVLARAIGEGRLALRANCAARTMVADIAPIAEITQRTGVPMGAETSIPSLRVWVPNLGCVSSPKRPTSWPCTGHESCPCPRAKSPL